jgi:putative cell wall-binding protein
VVVLAETDADSTACALSKRFFTRSQSVVVCSSNDYSGALVAAVLAARERAPLLYSSGATLEEPVRAELVRLGTTKVLYVGASAADYADLNGVTAERLPTALDVAH